MYLDFLCKYYVSLQVVELKYYAYAFFQML